MTVASLFSDMILIGVFMLAGFFCKRNRETYPEAVPSGFPDRRTSGTAPWSADTWPC